MINPVTRRAGFSSPRTLLYLICSDMSIDFSINRDGTLSRKGIDRSWGNEAENLLFISSQTENNHTNENCVIANLSDW